MPASQCIESGVTVANVVNFNATELNGTELNDIIFWNAGPWSPSCLKCVCTKSCSATTN